MVAYLFDGILLSLAKTHFLPLQPYTILTKLYREHSGD
jgi:hypothetical protein